MAKVQNIDPVKLFVAVLWSDEKLLKMAIEKMQEKWGMIDFVGEDKAFDVTDYYVSEMGEKIQRRLISFKNLVMPDCIAEAKLLCNAIEDFLQEDGKRKANLDVGYLDHSKIVLASAKFAGQKIYLDRGIYADMIMRFAHGKYQSFEWTFPDFKDGRYQEELIKMRKIYMIQLREMERRD